MCAKRKHATDVSIAHATKDLTHLRLERSGLPIDRKWQVLAVCADVCFSGVGPLRPGQP